LLHTQDQFDVCPKPFVDQFLNVNVFFLGQFAYKVVHVWLKIDWKAEHGVGLLVCSPFSGGYNASAPPVA
jgi:hypothetical protein